MHVRETSFRSIGWLDAFGRRQQNVEHTAPTNADPVRLDVVSGSPSGTG